MCAVLQYIPFVSQVTTLPLSPPPANSSFSVAPNISSCNSHTMDHLENTHTESAPPTAIAFSAHREHASGASTQSERVHTSGNTTQDN